MKQHSDEFNDSIMSFLFLQYIFFGHDLIEIHLNYVKKKEVSKQVENGEKIEHDVINWNN